MGANYPKASTFMRSEFISNDIKIFSKSSCWLKQRLIDKGVPKQIMEMPALSFDYVEAKLERWELL
jgi:hypothetical protein